MKSPAITGNRVTLSNPAVSEPSEKKPAVQHISNPAIPDKPSQGVQTHHGRARAAELRQKLGQLAPASEQKSLPAAGTVIKYPTDPKSTRRQRSESHEDLMPLDEEINRLNGSRRAPLKDRNQVLAQRRQANLGFKRVVSQRTESVDEMVIDGWGDDH